MYKAIKISKDIYWVGALDYSIAQFHGYNTQRGATYNAYLIIDDKITLIDTVKSTHTQEMIERIKSVVDITKIDYLISNHVEMDHSGSIPEIIKYNPNIKVFTSFPAGKIGLEKHFGPIFKDIVSVKAHDTISTGNHEFEFIPTPFLHWPDNMFCYDKTTKYLFSNDGFGQHLCTNSLYDSEFNNKDVLFYETKKYFANILNCYCAQADKIEKELVNYDIKMILPSHGLIIKKYVKEMIDSYINYTNQDKCQDATIVYDSMWHSTEKMAFALNEKLTQMGIKTYLFDLKKTHYSDIVPFIIDSKYVFIGTPTLNNNMMPTVSAFLTYYLGLNNKKKLNFVFGSYGWNGFGAIKAMEMLQKELNETNFLDKVPYKIQFVPTEDDLIKFTTYVENLIKQR